MHQQLFTANTYYQNDVDAACDEMRTIIITCFAHETAGHYAERVVWLVNEYIHFVKSEHADDCWYDIFRMIPPEGTVSDWSAVYRGMYDEIQFRFFNSFSRISELVSTIRSHPKRTSESDRVFDLGYYLDQLVRPDNQEFLRAELIIARSRYDVDMPGTQSLNWEQHKQVLLHYASELRIPLQLFSQLSLEYHNQTAAERCAQVEQVGTSLINCIYPLAVIESNRIAAILTEFPSHMQRAYIAFCYACRSSGEHLTSRNAFAWLTENGCPRNLRLARSESSFSTYVRKVQSRITSDEISSNGLGLVAGQNGVELHELGHAYRN
jgi:hypothetical protein